MNAVRALRQPAWPLRLVAVACAGLIAILVWLAADPAAHHALHDAAAAATAGVSDHDHGSENDDAGCIVTTFLVGATDLFWLAILSLLFALRPLASLPATARLIPGRAPFARSNPSCGPPRLA